MKSTICLFAVSVFSASLVLPPAAVGAGESDGKPPTVAVAQVSKSRHLNACRARYRDCLKAKQIPPFECQYIYTDCMNHIY
jgi:hypothetical protein